MLPKACANPCWARSGWNGGAETVEGAANGTPRPHEVARGLAALFAERPIALSEFEAIIAARGFDSSAEHFADFAALEVYLDATGGALMRLAARILGAGEIGTVARDAALAYGLAGLLRSLPFHNRRHKLYLPLDLLQALNLTPDEFFIRDNDPRKSAAIQQTALRARDHFRLARQSRLPRLALAALLPAALTPVYLKRLGKEVPIHRRQMALLAAAMKRRL